MSVQTFSVDSLSRSQEQPQRNPSIPTTTQLHIAYVGDRPLVPTSTAIFRQDYCGTGLNHSGDSIGYTTSITTTTTSRHVRPRSKRTAEGLAGLHQSPWFNGSSSYRNPSIFITKTSLFPSHSLGSLYHTIDDHRHPSHYHSYDQHQKLQQHQQQLQPVLAQIQREFEGKPKDFHKIVKLTNRSARIVTDFSQVQKQILGDSTGAPNTTTTGNTNRNPISNVTAKVNTNTNAYSNTNKKDTQSILVTNDSPSLQQDPAFKAKKKRNRRKKKSTPASAPVFNTDKNEEIMSLTAAAGLPQPQPQPQQEKEIEKLPEILAPPKPNSITQQRLQEQHKHQQQLRFHEQLLRANGSAFASFASTADIISKITAAISDQEDDEADRAFASLLNHFSSTPIVDDKPVSLENKNSDASTMAPASASASSTKTPTATTLNQLYRAAIEKNNAKAVEDYDYDALLERFQEQETDSRLLKELKLLLISLLPDPTIVNNAALVVKNVNEILEQSSIGTTSSKSHHHHYHHQQPQHSHNHAYVLPFGSTVSGLATRRGDLDLFLVLPSHHPVAMIKSDQVSNTKNRQNLGKLTSLIFDIRLVLDEQMIQVDAIPNARVPLIKFLCPRPRLQCDLSFHNATSILNTSIIKQLVHFNPAFRDLAITVKYWAKVRGINNSRIGYLSSYAFTCLVICFMQQKRLLPQLKTDVIDALTAQCENICCLPANLDPDYTLLNLSNMVEDSYEVYLNRPPARTPHAARAVDPSMAKHSAILKNPTKNAYTVDDFWNHDELEAVNRLDVLFIQFLQWLKDIDFNDVVVSPRQGVLIDRNRHRFSHRSYFFMGIEDLSKPGWNVTSNVEDMGPSTEISEEAIRALDIIQFSDENPRDIFKNVLSSRGANKNGMKFYRGTSLFSD